MTTIKEEKLMNLIETNKLTKNLSLN